MELFPVCPKFSLVLVGVIWSLDHQMYLDFLGFMGDGMFFVRVIERRVLQF